MVTMAILIAITGVSITYGKKSIVILIAMVLTYQVINDSNNENNTNLSNNRF